MEFIIIGSDLPGIILFQHYIRSNTLLEASRG
jgi:hypothetical protein